MNRVNSFLLIVILITGGCQDKPAQRNTLPSNLLIDSVIYGAIKDCGINVFYYSDRQIDSLVQIEEWTPNIRLNSRLLDWYFPSIKRGKDIQKSKLSPWVFNFSFIKQKLYKQDSLQLFDSDDSSFMCLQIKNSNLDTLNLKAYADILYISDNDIDRRLSLIKQNIEQQFSYCVFSQPLFNVSKTYAILGISIYHISTNEFNHASGDILIMKRKCNDWVILSMIWWWEHFP